MPSYLKIPKKIKIGGIIYKVTLKPHERTSFLDREDDELNINPRLSNQQMEIALLHGIIHGINLGITDEILVEGLAQGLHQVLKDNGFLSMK
jgi:hypothetical protein